MEKEERKIRREERFVFLLALLMFVMYAIAVLFDREVVKWHFLYLLFGFMTSVLAGICLIRLLNRNKILIKERQQMISEMKHSEMETEYKNSLQLMEKELQSLKEQKSVMLKEAIRLYENRNYEELRQELNIFFEQTAYCYQMIQTGNPVLDIVFSQKIAFAGQRDIHIALDIGNIEIMNIEDADLSVVLSNLLDNAIEAVGAIKKLPSEKRVITVRMRKNNNFLILNIRNPYDIKQGMKQLGSDGLPLTTKRDKKMHGYGLRSVKRISEKYAGHLIMEEQNGFFQTSVVMEDEYKNA